MKINLQVHESQLVVINDFSADSLKYKQKLNKILLSIMEVVCINELTDR